MSKILTKSLIVFLVCVAGTVYAQKNNPDNILPIARNTLHGYISNPNQTFNDRGWGQETYFAIPEAEFNIIDSTGDLDTLFSFKTTNLTFRLDYNSYADCEVAWRTWWVESKGRLVGKFSIRTKKSDKTICDYDQWPIGVCRFQPISQEKFLKQ